jgi:hypothetical protein
MPSGALDDTGSPDGRMHQIYLGEFESGRDLLHDLFHRCKTGQLSASTRAVKETPDDPDPVR